MFLSAKLLSMAAVMGGRPEQAAHAGDSQLAA